MASKDLRRMSRGELLEMLIVQMEENESLRNQLIKVQAQLQNKLLEMLISQLEENQSLRSKLNKTPAPAEEMHTPFREKDFAPISVNLSPMTQAAAPIVEAPKALTADKPFAPQPAAEKAAPVPEKAVVAPVVEAPKALTADKPFAPQPAAEKAAPVPEKAVATPVVEAPKALTADKPLPSLSPSAGLGTAPLPEEKAEAAPASAAHSSAEQLQQRLKELALLVDERSKNI